MAEFKGADPIGGRFHPRRTCERAFQQRRGDRGFLRQRARQQAKATATTQSLAGGHADLYPGVPGGGVALEDDCLRPGVITKQGNRAAGANLGLVTEHRLQGEIRQQDNSKHRWLLVL